MMSSISAANADGYNIDEYLQVAFKLDGRRLGQYSNGSLGDSSRQSTLEP